MASYQTQRDKINDYLIRIVIPEIKKNKDVDYYKTVKFVAGATGSSETMVENVIQNLSATGQIKEHRVLTIFEEELSDFVKSLKEKEEEVKKTDLKMEEIEQQAVKEIME
jgi:hypothetical protein